MKIDKEFAKALEGLTSKSEKMVDDIYRYVKKHKKLILTLLAVYLVSKYLFSEGDDDDNYGGM